MRIAYLTQPYPPMVSGASIVAEQLAKAMAARGHEVLVIAASETGRPYIETAQNLTVLRLRSIHNPLRVNQRIMFLQRRAVLQALYKFKPDVIHVHEPVQMGAVGLKYVKHANIPITMTSHQLPWFVASYLPNLPGLRAWMEKLVWKYAGFIVKKFTVIVSPTQTIASIIRLRTGVAPSVIPFGINLMNFHPFARSSERIATRVKLNLPLYAPVILHVGRLDLDKSVDHVIHAAADSIHKSNAHLLIVGDGCQKPALIDLSKSLRINTRVHFSGFISNKEELAKIYQAADVFITASEIETQGIVILEAAACGLPIVAVNTTCIPEIVHHGCNGYLTDPGDTISMGKLIEEILSDTDLANLMSKQSRLIAEKYQPEITFDEHERLYRQMVKQRVFTKIWQPAKMSGTSKKIKISSKNGLF